MHSHWLQGMFSAANHFPQVQEQLNLAKIHWQFRDNGLDITVKPIVKKMIGLRSVVRF
jgi:hypothetical protein